MHLVTVMCELNWNSIGKFLHW